MPAFRCWNLYSLFLCYGYLLWSVLLCVVVVERHLQQISFDCVYRKRNWRREKSKRKKRNNGQRAKWDCDSVPTHISADRKKNLHFAKYVWKPEVSHFFRSALSCPTNSILIAAGELKPNTFRTEISHFKLTVYLCTRMNVCMFTTTTALPLAVSPLLFVL